MALCVKLNYIMNGRKGRNWVDTSISFVVCILWSISNLPTKHCTAYFTSYRQNMSPIVKNIS